MSKELPLGIKIVYQVYSTDMQKETNHNLFIKADPHALYDFLADEICVLNISIFFNDKEELYLSARSAMGRCNGYTYFTDGTYTWTVKQLYDEFINKPNFKYINIHYNIENYIENLINDRLAHVDKIKKEAGRRYNHEG